MDNVLDRDCANLGIVRVLGVYDDAGTWKICRTYLDTTYGPAEGADETFLFTR